MPRMVLLDILSTFSTTPQVTRITATKYLEELVKIGLLTKHKKWKENYYMNDALIDLLVNGGSTLEATS